MTEPIEPEVLDFAHQMLDLARGGVTEQLAEYVDAGLPVNLTNDKGDSLLMVAAYHNHPTTVAALLDRGAEVDRINDRGQTALAAAVFRRSSDSINALLAAGADPAVGSPSAVEMARSFNLPDVLALLERRA